MLSQLVERVLARRPFARGAWVRNESPQAGRQNPTRWRAWQSPRRPRLPFSWLPSARRYHSQLPRPGETRGKFPIPYSAGDARPPGRCRARAASACSVTGFLIRPSNSMRHPFMVVRRPGGLVKATSRVRPSWASWRRCRANSTPPMWGMSRSIRIRCGRWRSAARNPPSTLWAVRTNAPSRSSLCWVVARTERSSPTTKTTKPRKGVEVTRSGGGGTLGIWHCPLGIEPMRSVVIARSLPRLGQIPCRLSAVHFVGVLGSSPCATFGDRGQIPRRGLISREPTGWAQRTLSLLHYRVGVGNSAVNPTQPVIEVARRGSELEGWRRADRGMPRLA